MDVGVAPYPPIEGFYFSPLKVLEYMAAGRPTVASRVGDIRELVNDGVEGTLVPPGDARALQAALLKLMSDRNLCTTMGSAARKKVLTYRTWDIAARRILRIGGILGRSPGEK